MTKRKFEDVLIRNLQVTQNAQLGNTQFTGAVDGWPEPVQSYYVDVFTGTATGDGKSWATAFSTMALALAAVETGGKVFFRGKIAEQITGSNLKFDVTIIGVGSLHHADLPAAGYDTGAAVWQAPASPTSSHTAHQRPRPRLEVLQHPLRCPGRCSSVRLTRNSSSDVAEHDASHASIIGCDFRNGLYGIHDCDGCYQRHDPGLCL